MGGQEVVKGGNYAGVDLYALVNLGTGFGRLRCGIHGLSIGGILPCVLGLMVEGGCPCPCLRAVHWTEIC